MLWQIDGRLSRSYCSLLLRLGVSVQGLAAGGKSSSEAASLQVSDAPAGTAAAAAAAVLRHLRNEETLCAMLGLRPPAAEGLHDADTELQAAACPSGTASSAPENTCHGRIALHHYQTNFPKSYRLLCTTYHSGKLSFTWQGMLSWTPFWALMAPAELSGQLRPNQAWQGGLPGPS